MRRSIALLLPLALAGCVETIEALGQAAVSTVDAVDRAGAGLSTPSPVTGRRVPNLASEEEEIARARDGWEQLRSAAIAQGIAVDPPGPRSDQMRQVFRRLLQVAHRQHLPWEVHLIDDPMVNAMTPGGGQVFVFEGLFGGLVPPADDDALAAVLAHEIAHVSHLHVSSGGAWRAVGGLLSSSARDEYYQAAYTTEQEAEADQLGVLYMALAGYDPFAPSKVWEAAHRREGSSAGRYAYLNNHPLNAERIAITRDAAAKVVGYYTPGTVNPNWSELLASNALYTRTDLERGSGALLILEQTMKHRQAKAEAEERKAAARTLRSLTIARVWDDITRDGFRGVFAEVRNAGPGTVTGLALTVYYYGGERLVGQDDSCSANVSIGPGQTARVGCYKRQVPGASSVALGIADATVR